MNKDYILRTKEEWAVLGVEISDSIQPNYIDRAGRSFYSHQLNLYSKEPNVLKTESEWRSLGRMLKLNATGISKVGTFALFYPIDETVSMINDSVPEENFDEGFDDDFGDPLNWSGMNFSKETIE